MSGSGERVGPPLSPVRVLGQTVYASGQIGIDPATGTVPERFEDEVRLALASLDAALASVGSTAADVVQATIYLTSALDFTAMNAVYAAHFGAPFPARTTLITGLALPELRFEIDAVAGLGDGVG
jgi:2-iminobutanoate/2-iminopropanoate deaminase